MHDIIDKTLSLKKYNIDRWVISPERWMAYADSTPLSWTAVRFDKLEQNLVPDDKCGVYSFIVKPGIADHPQCAYLLYVGKAQDQSLRRRFAQYFHERNASKGRPKIQKMLTLWQHHLWFCYAPIDDTSRIHNVELKLIGAFLPPMNDEFPAEIKKAMKAW
jgi:hypothetical protein